MISIDLAGRSAVVTGASFGIGASVVATLAAAGADVAFCARGAEGVRALEASCTGSPGRVHGFIADMAEADSVAAFCDEAERTLGGTVDILVNNVGASRSRNFLRMTDEDWSELLQINLMSAVRCTRRYLPGMREQKWGRVVMISTMAARYPNAAVIDYAASKAALVATAKALARRYAIDGVLVNSVLPGRIRTPMWDDGVAQVAKATGAQFDDVLEARAKEIPLGRYGDPAEIASSVLFLVSELGSYVTGSTLDVDGGHGAHLL